MTYWNNKVAVVTGAGSGIGRALALEWARMGAKLALCDYQSATLEETVNLIHQQTQHRPFTQVIDVAQEAAVYAFATAVEAHYGRVDAVINNAGVVQITTDVLDISTADFEWLMNINFWGMVYGSRAFLPLLRKQSKSYLANVSSLFGMMVVPGLSSYHASKFAIRGFTESLGLEERCHKTGVVVSSIHPGGIKTNIIRASRGLDASLEEIEKLEKPFLTSPEHAAKTILKGMRKKKSRIIVGMDAHLIYRVQKLWRGVVERVTVWNYNQVKINQ